jgi:NTE family protein
MTTQDVRGSKNKENMPVPEKQRVLILQGGGALGAYEAGVFEVLYNKLRTENPNGSLFDIVAGTSAGAINASFLVNHFKVYGNWDQAAEKLTQFWTNSAVDTSEDVRFWTNDWESYHRLHKHAASPEAARRYYSAKYLLQNGAGKKWFKKADMVLDSKFLDNYSTFPNNIWFRYGKSELRKALSSFDFPIVTAAPNQPRLLVISTDVRNAATVTFDSYQTKSTPGDKQDLPGGNGKQYQKSSARHSGGVELEHVLASSSIPLFHQFEVIRDKGIFCDGGVLSNTPLREVLQAHRDYWYKDVGDGEGENKDRDVSVPDLEIYIVGVWPTESKASTPEVEHYELTRDFDNIKGRLFDINLSDKTVYDEKVATMVSDYVNLIKKMTVEIPERFLKTNKEKDEFVEYLRNLYYQKGERRGRDGKKRPYGELLRGRAKIRRIVRIECKPDTDSIANKAFDLSTKSIETLIERGRSDAKEILYPIS